MKHRVLIVIDMQNDFITGPLGSSEAQAIVPKVVKKMHEYHERGDEIFCTLDSHKDNYLETPEGKALPVKHCIEGDEGWMLHPDIADARVCATCFTKDGIGFCGWNKFVDKRVDEIEIVGVCTDICVITNALVLHTFYPSAKIIVDASCCAGSTPEAHRQAIRVMENCMIKVTNQGTIQG